MSSALLCADLALDNPFVFVPQAKPDLLRKRLPNLSKLAGVTLGSRLEIRGAPEIVFSGIPEIDMLSDGLPRGCLTEICGPVSSGRTSVLLAVIAAATRRQEICALVDTSDAFDPQSATSAGVDFKRLLWVRCCAPNSYVRTRNTNREDSSSHANNASLKAAALASENSRNDRSESAVEQALRVTDLLLQSGGFGLVVIDLADVPFKTARRIPLTSWFRFRRAVEHTPTVLLVISQQSCAQTCASLLLGLNGIEKVFSMPAASTSDAPAHAQLLRGLSINAELLRSRLERKPVRSVHASFNTKMSWAG
ncbi:MAG: hypothetical protein DMG73_12430 [Acidobacteria bacterium]|nr:MAG: hypothetical protein DMG73_12430 [Acidobacteriota bacterium]PYX64141.1 MAG: hypothetical protein DMG74_14430 [Acidobacteriota bacterium]